MFVIISAVLILSIGFIFIVFISSQSGGYRDNTKLSTFINHPDCFVRITDKTDYIALENGLGSAPAGGNDEYIKSNLDIRIYDIRSAIFNFPDNRLPQYKEIISYPSDIYELFCMMEPHVPKSQETAYIYKSGGNKVSDMDGNMGISVFGFGVSSLNAFIRLGILSPDNAQSTIGLYSSELSITELLASARQHGITLIGSTKDELFKSAYKHGLLSKMQLDAKPYIAYKVTEHYYAMETAFFETYCNDIAKNLAGAGRIYVDSVIDRACKVNMFSKTRPENRLTAMLQQIKHPAEQF